MMLGALRMHPLTISLSDYLSEKLKRQTQVYETFAEEKQERLAELLALNGEKPLESEAKREMETLLAEEQALQLRNLDML